MTATKATTKVNKQSLLTKEQQKASGPNVKTVTPDNDNGKPGVPDKKDSSNKGKGPKGESL